MPTHVRSFCKINLGLAVGPPRADGFHALTTLYQTLGLHDLVTVSAKMAGTTHVTLTANHKWVPCSATGNAEKNTAWKMVVGALLRLGVTAEVSIDIDKRLPVQGGLGAGSANAFAALIGLERELGVALPGPERLALAAQVGSDVPLFLLGGTVLGYDRGQQVAPLPDFAEVYCVVAVPSVGVSTAQAFRDLDAREAGGSQGLKPHLIGQDNGWAEAQPLQSRARLADNGRIDAGKSGAAQSDVGQTAAGQNVVTGLTGQAATPLTFAQVTDRLEELSRVYAGVFTISGVEPGASGIPRSTTGITGRTSGLAENPLLTLVRTGIENDFEEVAFSQHPSLRSIKRDLAGEGPSSALYASLSGSGSALFGLYRSEPDAVAAQQRVQGDGTNGIQALLTKTLPRPEYWASMFAE